MCPRFEFFRSGTPHLGIRLRHPSHIRRIQPFRPLLAFELHGLAFVQRLVAVLLDGRKMDEHIFTARALNESVALGSVKPLHHSLFLHSISPSVLGPGETLRPADPPNRQAREPSILKTARAAYAPTRLALRQLDSVPKLRLGREQTKTSNACSLPIGSPLARR